MRHVPAFLLMVVAIVAAVPGLGRAQAPSAASIQLWAVRNYSTWDNPLHTEVTLNGTTVNIFTAEKMEPISLKDGWNVLTLKTTPQQPANRNNGLIFRIGPTHKDPGKNRVTMDQVLWQFRNDTDWKLENGVYSHPLGPDTKEVTLTYNLYFAGLDREGVTVKAGDYVLVGQPGYNSWNSPVIGTVFVNGTPLNSFTLAERRVVITPLLKEGRNEVRVVSARVKNSIRNNDISFSISGPAEWNVSRNQYVVPPVTQFKAMQGWTLEPSTGMLFNPLKRDADTIERNIPFMMKPVAK